MDRLISGLIFLSVFFAILFLTHLYSYSRLSTLFGVNKRAWHYLVIVLLSSSLILTTILCRISYNGFTRGLYTLTACWFGVIFILFFLVLFHEPIGFFFKVRGTVAGKAIIFSLAILSAASMINTHFIRIKTVAIPSFGAELNAVLLTDIHVGTIWSKGRLNKIVEMANSLEPDVVFITGDMVSGGAVFREDTLSPLGDLKAETFFVNGNHEHYDGTEEIEKALRRLGITVLNDEKIDMGEIEVVGVDYHRDGSRAISALDKISISANKPTILLSHVPLDPKNDRIDLILAGHTHAGQIFPFNFFVGLRYGFTKGLYELGDTRLYVSPGTGTWGPPMRLGSRNEITCLRLR